MIKFPIVFCLFFVTTVNAQNDSSNRRISFGLNVQLNASYITSDRFDWEKDYRLFFGGGGFANISFSKKFSLQSELNYEMQGGSFWGISSDGNGRRVLYNIDMQYLSIPVLFQYHFSKKMYIETGMTLSFLLKAKYIDEGRELTTTNFFQNINLSIPIGVQYKINKNLHAGFRITPGVYNIWKYQSAVNVKTFGANLRLSYQF